MIDPPASSRHIPAQSKPASACRVWSCNEWDPLEEVIVGTPWGARRPTPDVSTQFLLYPDRPLDSLPDEPFPQRVIDETEEDLSRFCGVLASHGVTVHRPGPHDTDLRYSTPDWAAHGFHTYCPRDVLTVVGNRIIESPCAMRSRAYESMAYRSILVDYLRTGARWFSAPKPALRDSAFKSLSAGKRIPHDEEPIFDAANVLRLGYDLLYLVSSSGNLLGAHWLQTVLGDEYTVHCVEDTYYGCHIDSTFVALRPGLVLCNPARVPREKVPNVFRGWEVVYSPPMANSRQGSDWSIASDWIGMNVFSISPSVAVVDQDQGPLISLLEKHGLDVIPLPLRHARVLGGGFHCVTLDVRRRGVLERYGDAL
ncbi:inosamine-phosphate amidinotransferase 1 [Hyalangium versicolor]|uniref:inosamine-phosphate amidinotransferase 1 n=1 Tax=Hyalangium versicolor TaxID=2861190 RepID=UPI001CCAB7A3|nr:inosamine-phosphate amidinotransferase 1 [Hyalangium versicolor]